MKTRQLAYLSLILALLTGFAFAQQVEHGPLVLSDARIRATQPGASVTAAYVSITNTGAKADYLVSARTEIAGRVEIHKMEMHGDVMRMRPFDGSLEIPAGETVTLEAGGLHLMLMNLAQMAKKGETASLTLLFEHSGEIQLKAQVVSLAHGH